MGKVRVPGEAILLSVEEDVSIQFRWIPPGHFVMGASESDYGEEAEKPSRTVTFFTGFFMGSHQVTQGQWTAVMGNNPSYFHLNGEDNPVEQVSWFEAKEFIGKINARSDRFTYSLPTEAEWEYAARAGTKSPFAFGHDFRSSHSITSTQANFAGDDPFFMGLKGPNLKRTTRVGSYEANKWGLYDMHGNVWEWVEDVWSETYKDLACDGPADMTYDGSANMTYGDASYRVIRGGAWNSPGVFLRSACRVASEPNARQNDIGFRLVAKLR